ncbi:hypothetical protein M1N20_02705 [Dehalococcoidia bacterium]|nr:hypothetical protein [Dehalococcoidia bacterium]
MGHLHTDMTVRGSKADVELKNVLINTGATYTVLPEKVLEGVGAWGPVGEVEIELGNGEKVKAKAYGVAIKLEEVEAPSISITFEGAQIRRFLPYEHHAAMKCRSRRKAACRRQHGELRPRRTRYLQYQKGLTSAEGP